MKITKILRDSPLGLKSFNAKYLQALEHGISERGGKYFAVCAARGVPVQLKPEEVVRQLFLMSLMDEYGYPKNRLNVEYPVTFGSSKKRADIVVMDEKRPNVPYIVVELKSPKERDGKAQLRSYCNATGAPMAVWCNGAMKICYHRKDPNYFEEIRDIPAATRTLAELLQISWTLNDLIREDVLVREGRSLKDMIEQLEDEVLAGAGVNSFEEVFKMVFAKLYDEWVSGCDEESSGVRNLEFHNAGETDGELRKKIQKLFDKAKEQWSGVFAEEERLQLTPSHLAVCVGSLERVKLFNSNLDVVDDAFEYLINKEAKGEKGQYFTPRYVIDMCVKMLDPDEGEYMIDPAAGSSGFPIHTIFHVWKKILHRKGKKASHLFTIERKPAACDDYVRKRVFAVDFDEKAVRVSRALNLIAGDGQSNVLRLNTLDYERWRETTEDESWRDVYHEGERKLRRLRTDKNSARDHKFDIVMANPPFAGDIRESEIIHLYELGRKMEWRKNIKTPTRSKKWHEKISRHILFIERNLQFLKPGGRMAIVLPQGIFNNITDFPQRHFIMENCRILAVVGLHTNTFKPHTGTKTSVLFVQKWNDDEKAGALCPHKKDYNIFFATMQKSGKDNSGDKIFIKRPHAEDEETDAAENNFILDANGHLVVAHDLFNLFFHHFPDGDDNENTRALLDSPGIAEAFAEFAKKEGLSFAKKIEPFNESHYKELLDGLDATESSLSQATKYLIVGSEFHSKRKRATLDKMKSEVVIGDYFSLVQRTISQLEEPSAVYDLSHAIGNFLPGKTLNDGINSSKKSPSQGDFIISRLRSYLREMAVVPERKYRQVVSSEFFVLRKKKDSVLTTHALLPFCLSEHVQTVLHCSQYGTEHPRFYDFSLLDMPIPLSVINISAQLSDLLIRGNSLIQQSEIAYESAENMLLSEIGLDKWRADGGGISVKKFDAVSAANRWDAEYYQPKYDDIMNALRRVPHMRLGDIVNIKKSIEPGSDAYRESGIPFVRVADLSQFGVSSGDKFLDENEYEKEIVALSPRKNTILFSKDGTLGIACKMEENMRAITSGAILHLTARPGINPDYLTLVLNALPTRMQAERDSGGAIIQHWRLDQIRDVVIPMPSAAVQHSLVAHVQKSFRLRRESGCLLQTAKAAVETAIEKGEKAATQQLALPPNSKTN